MVVIRLARGGAKKRPFFHVVVADKRNPRNGRFLERIGFYDTMASGQATPLRLDLERFGHWLGKGAKPSPAVSRLARLCRRNNDKKDA